MRAFTLIEVMASLAIFAILAALCYGALSRTLESAKILNARMDRLQAIQRTMRLLTEDLQQLAPRPIRDELGENTPGPAERYDSRLLVSIDAWESNPY